MESNFMQNIRQNEYFNSLPKSVQESIMQSGTDISDEEQLRELSRSFLGENSEQ